MESYERARTTASLICFLRQKAENSKGLEAKQSKKEKKNLLSSKTNRHAQEKGRDVGIGRR